MSSKIIKCSDNDSRASFAEFVLNQAKPMKYEVFDYNPRSIKSNALSWIWYGEIAKQTFDWTESDAHCFCKLTFGVPILRADDTEYSTAYQRLIEDKHNYEEQLELMRWWPVTREMNRDQMRRYLDAMQQYFAHKNIVLFSRCEIDYSDVA